MRLLLDTHCWLWWITQPSRLSGDVQSLIADRLNEVYLSAASSWEIAIKYNLGKIQLNRPPKEYVPYWLSSDGFSSLPIHNAHALRTADLPRHHRDPFDRLIIAQAQIEAMTIITADAWLAAYDVTIIRSS